MKKYLGKLKLDAAVERGSHGQVGLDS